MSGFLTATVGAAAIVALSPVTGPTVTTAAAAVPGSAVDAALTTTRCPRDIYNQDGTVGDPSKGSTFHGPSYAPGYGRPRYTQHVSGSPGYGCIGTGSGSEAVTGSSTAGAGGGASGAGAGGGGAGAAGGGAGAGGSAGGAGGGAGGGGAGGGAGGS